MSVSSADPDESLQFDSPTHHRTHSGERTQPTSSTWADDDRCSPSPSQRLSIPHTAPSSSVAFPKSPIDEVDEEEEEDVGDWRASSTSRNSMSKVTGQEPSIRTHKASSLGQPFRQRPSGHGRTKSAPLNDRYASSAASPRPGSSGSSTSSEEEEEEEEMDETLRKASPHDTLASIISPRQTALSLTSLRNIASQWVPGSSRRTSPQTTPRMDGSAILPGEAPSSALIPTPHQDAKQVVHASSSQRPVRLDRRRLDKAVSLAVEAAQAAEADDQAQKERARRRRRKERAARRRAKALAQEEEERARHRKLSFDHASVGGALMARIRTISEYGTSYAAGKGSSKPASVSASAAASGASSRQPSPTRSTRFNSLPWRGTTAESSKTSPKGSVNTSARGSLPSLWISPSAEQSQDESDSGGAGAPAVSGLGLVTGEDDVTLRAAPNAGSQSAASDSEEEGETENQDNFSLSLYLSSLSYLLSALPSKEAEFLPDRDKEELRTKLREMLSDIGAEADASSQDVQPKPASLSEEEKEQRLRELLEEELRRAEARMLGYTSSPKEHQHQQQQRRRGNHSRPPPKDGLTHSQNSTLVGTLASTALDVGFAVTAAGVGLLGTGLALLAPRLAASDDVKRSAVTDSPTGAGAKIVGEVREDEQALTTVNRKGRKKNAHSNAPVPSGAPSNGLQWDLAKALASSTASALYASLSSAAAEAVREEQLHHDEQRSLTEVTPEDRLVNLTSSFVRGLKRSPLPSQLSTLTAQLTSLLAALDVKYRIRQRALDHAVKGTRNGMRYVRKRGWHVIFVRGLWALVEMGLEGVSVWREDDEEEEEEEEESGGLDEAQEPVPVAAVEASPAPQPSRTSSWSKRMLGPRSG